VPPPGEAECKGQQNKYLDKNVFLSADFKLFNLFAQIRGERIKDSNFVKLM
jgi:hypothetical protein